MSDIPEIEATESSGNENSKSKYEMPANVKEKLKDWPEVLEYVHLLERQIRKQKKKLKKIKAKLKKPRKLKEASTQTSDPPNEPPNNIFDESKPLSEQIKEAAELATQNSGFVYDEVSGMYYDSTTGYYYSAEYGLYYDASTGIYMTYNQENASYDFHSQVYPHRQTGHKKAKRKKPTRDESTKAPKCVRRASPQDDAEEGECSMSSNCSSGSESEESKSDHSDVAKQWPPCMRVIVEQSKSPKIKIGALHLLTYDGGTLGREGDHAILLPDINISKCHLKFRYDQEHNHYVATDVGSRNGTILNGKRMSAAKQESEPQEVAHGSRIQIGSIVLLCHVHEGSKTCGHCEPGLVQVAEKPEPVVVRTKSENYKTELKNLRKKFGVTGYEEGGPKVGTGYTDRAQQRRVTVGSQNHNEKTEVASLNESIPAQNKGFKMLAKMGWQEGQSLGKDNQGMLEPVPLVSNPGTSGIGTEAAGIVVENVQRSKVSLKSSSKQLIWKKTQERFQKLPSTNIFEESDDY